MNIHFALCSGRDYMDAIESHGVENIYALCAYPYRNAMYGHKAGDFKGFIADSGAFTAMTAGLKIDDKYVQDYVQWIKDNGIQNYVELDLDEVIGVEETKSLTSKLEAMVGFPSIPVWHCERRKQGWMDMCDNYDYVSISLSGYTKTSKWLRAHKYQPLKWFLDYARKTDTRVHALGCTNVELLKRYKFYSSDSSTYSVGGRYGTILEFRNGVLISKRPNPEFKKDRRAIIKQDVEATYRMARYAERYM